MSETAKPVCRKTDRLDVEYDYRTGVTSKEVHEMANQEHLDILKQGVSIWNQWREEHQEIDPDLSGADLSGANLSEAYLVGADLSEADLSETILEEAKCMGADLSGADLSRALLNTTVALLT